MAEVPLLDRDWLTVTEAAAALGLTGQGIHDRIAAGYLRGMRVHGRLTVIPREDVERMKHEGRLRPGPKPGSGRGGRPRKARPEAESPTTLPESS